MKKKDMRRSHFMRMLLKWCIMIKLLWVAIVAGAIQVSAGKILSYSQTVR